MRFLVDENLSPALCRFLSLGADSAEHVREALGAATADHVILEHAADHDAVVVTADTDFGTFIARSSRTRPSVILMRDLLGLPAEDQGRLLAANLDEIRRALEQGAIVAFTRAGLRVRPLPIA